MPLTPLAPHQLRRTCDPESFSFETTADLPLQTEIIGQLRGTRAIEFGIDIDSPGYNIFVLGEEGTGRTTAIGRFLRQRAAGRPTPQDWLYVHNFAAPHRARALNLPPGLGAVLRDDMAGLLEHLRQNLPLAFEQATYLEARGRIKEQFEAERDARFAALQARAANARLAIVRTPSGWTLAPLHEGQPMAPDVYEALPEAERKTYQAARRAMESELEAMFRAVRALEKSAREAQRSLDRQVAASVVDAYLQDLTAKYAPYEETVFYLNEVRQDIVDHASAFLPRDEPAEAGPREVVGPDFRKYAVNLVVDHSRTQGAPVVVELNPTFSKLLGRIEHEARFGHLVTDFTLIKTGALHAANGGYLVLRARDVFYEPLAWDALKRSLLSGYVHTEDITARAGMATTKSLDPEPIPLDLKVILVGLPEAYYTLFHRDEDFGAIFKVKADFASHIPRLPENEQQFALFIAARCADEELRPFDRGAVARVIEFSSRAAGDQSKLSVRFGAITDLLREANFWAGQAGRATVTADDVRAAVAEKIGRANKAEEMLRERILDGSIFIDTEGEVVGQVNALSLADSGDYLFGLPSRVTARTFVGHGGISQIERETNLAGPIHNKGLLTLSSFFNATYAASRSISFSAQITFEQTYGGVDGDSASSAELYALLSSLSRHPVRQSLAATGSVNQRGEVQPIGGVNEKIEGFFALCAARGLTGDQGVLIPAANVRDLMLNDQVVAAVAAGQFHIWPVRTVDEGIEILTGRPAGSAQDGRYPANTVHGAVHRRLRELSRGHDRDRADGKPRRRSRRPARKGSPKRAPRRRTPTRKRPATRSA